MPKFMLVQGTPTSKEEYRKDYSLHCIVGYMLSSPKTEAYSRWRGSALRVPKLSTTMLRSTRGELHL